jgi:ATP-dependent Clp protease ATP-binding subunit ClpC
VFERFTEPARQVVVLAQVEARALKHNYIGTEHLLLGLLRQEDSLAAQVLGSLGVTLEDVRGQVKRIVGHGEELTSGQIPFTPRGKKVLEWSLRESRSLGHNHIRPEHILLGLARENEGVAARILLDFDAEKIREEVLRMLSGQTRLEGSPEEQTGSRDILVLGRSRHSWWPFGRMPRRSIDYAVRRGAAPLLLGCLLFGSALGIGILIGWLIWG